MWGVSDWLEPTEGSFPRVESSLAKECQAGVDTALEYGVFGLSRQRLDAHLQSHAVGNIGHGEGMLRGGLGEVPY